MKTSLIIALAFFLPATILVQQSAMQMPMNPAEKPVTLLSGLGSLHHPTSTKDPEAQKFFDQGSRMIYGFNHQEAVGSFKRAAELDPQMAMAWWGVAYALGPNINLDVDPERETAAYEAEKVFRPDLDRNKNSGRSLFGLLESLKAQQKTEAAAAVQREFEKAWKNADTKLSIANL